MSRSLRILSVALAPIIVALFWLGGGAVASLKTEAYSVAPSRFSSWDEVLENPGPISLTTWETGWIHMDKRQLLVEHPLRAGMPDPLTPLPVLVHLAQHEHFGLRLIDTGFDASFQSSRRGNYGPFMQLFTWVFGVENTVAPGHDLGSRLQSNGLSPEAVYLTHLHPDHTAGLPALTADIPVFFPERDETFLARAAAGNHFAGKQILHTFDFSGAREMAPLGRALDLFGDGSFWALETPGHTPGHTSFLVNGRDGPVLLVGDACHFQWAFDNHVAPAGMGAEANVQSDLTLAQLTAFKQAYPQVHLVFGHDLPR